jgi:hypothetical protein
MARLNEDGQWIILLALIISISIFFLALIVNEATIVGQTTAESTLDFPKSDLQDLRAEVLRMTDLGTFNYTSEWDLESLSIYPGDSIVTVYAPPDRPPQSLDIITIHYNNGVARYNETIYY